jgi:hypothetical protein
MIDSIIIMSCFLLSILGWLVGIFSILGFFGFGNSGGEFGWIMPAWLFLDIGPLACGIHLLSFVIGISHFFREHFKIKEFHKLCIFGFVFSVVYLLTYSVLYLFMIICEFCG